jgi:2'-5' RNA ligase
MNTTSLIQIPGYNYNEYLLVLNLHEGLRDKIMQVKKEFSEKYKTDVALYSKPQITLVNFVQFEMIEERLVTRLKIIAAGYHSFKVDLKDYGSFPSHTIFINVASKQQVQNLIKELKPARQLMTINKENKPHFINDPYIIVARKLLPWQYEKGWLDYSNSHFTGSFIAQGMVLLKRQLRSGGDGQTGKYQTVQRFEFMNLPANIKQGELFMQ